MSKEKNKGGRPTGYRKEYCEQVIELMRQGASIEEVCFELNIAKQTFYNWCEQFPEFLDAKKIGVDLAHGWWMKQGRINLHNQKFSPTLFYMNMKNRFKWTDRQEVDNKVEISKLPEAVWDFKDAKKK